MYFFSVSLSLNHFSRNHEGKKSKFFFSLNILEIFFRIFRFFYDFFCFFFTFFFTFFWFCILYRARTPIATDKLVVRHQVNCRKPSPATHQGDQAGRPNIKRIVESPPATHQGDQAGKPTSTYPHHPTGRSPLQAIFLAYFSPFREGMYIHQTPFYKRVS